jgi:hypothetical protein
MGDELNIMDHVDQTGTFKETFLTEAVPAILGADFGETKCFANTPTLAHVIKGYAHGERKIGEKLENVIQKPPADATPEQKAEYRQVLLAELGGKKDAAEYNITIPDLPEGLAKNEPLIQKWLTRFAKRGLPQDMVQSFVDDFIGDASADYTATTEAQQKAFDAEVADFHRDFAGDEGIKAMRLAHDALMEHGNDNITMADGTVIKGVKEIMKKKDEAGRALYDKPTDLAAWRACGLEPANLRIWASVGKAMQSGFAARGEGTPGQGESVEQKGARLYDHPDSQRELVGKT